MEDPNENFSTGTFSTHASMGGISTEGFTKDSNTNSVTSSAAEEVSNENLPSKNNLALRLLKMSFSQNELKTSELRIS